MTPSRTTSRLCRLQTINLWIMGHQAGWRAGVRVSASTERFHLDARGGDEKRQLVGWRDQGRTDWKRGSGGHRGVHPIKSAGGFAAREKRSLQAAKPRTEIAPKDRDNSQSRQGQAISGP